MPAGCLPWCHETARDRAYWFAPRVRTLCVYFSRYSAEKRDICMPELFPISAFIRGRFYGLRYLSKCSSSKYFRHYSATSKAYSAGFITRPKKRTRPVSRSRMAK
jgi:hypothetical protein